MKRILIILLCFILFTSCEKIEIEKQLDGIWKGTPKIYNYDGIYQENYDFYEFDGNNIIHKYIFTYVDSTGEKIFTGGYEGIFKLKKEYLIIERTARTGLPKFLDDYYVKKIKFELTDTQLFLFHSVNENEYSTIYFKQ